MSKKRKRSTLEVMERDFNSAIDRLLTGKSMNPAKRQQAAKGRLKLNAAMVAQEAGHSRTLIAMENCRLPAIRKRIQEENRKGGVSASRTSREVTARLRNRIAELERDLAASLEAQSQHFLAREKAEREAEKWRNAMRRRDEHAKQEAKVVGIRSRGTRQ